MFSHLHKKSRCDKKNDWNLIFVVVDWRESTLAVTRSQHGATRTLYSIASCIVNVHLSCVVGKSLGTGMVQWCHKKGKT